MSLANRVQGLVEVLDAEERVYLELRSCLQREREALDALDAAALEEAVRAKEGITAEARLLEQARLDVARGLATQLGLDAERPRLAEICDALGPQAQELAAARTRLRALIAAVSELLEANASCAGQALGEVRATLDLFGGLLREDPTYARSGAPASRAEPGRLVHRSA